MGYLYLLFGFQPKLSTRLFGESERILHQPKSEPDRVCQMCASSAKLSEIQSCSREKQALQAVDSEGT
jgi:hypothetical protein